MYLIKKKKRKKKKGLHQLAEWLGGSHIKTVRRKKVAAVQTTRTPRESCSSANKNTKRKLQQCKLQEHQAKVAAVQTTRTPSESYSSANYKNTKRKLLQCKLLEYQAKVAAVQTTRTPSESCSSANYKNTKRKLQQSKQKHQATHQQLPIRTNMSRSSSLTQPLGR